MGEHATTKQAGAARQSASSKRPSVEMSAGDRNDFVDLLLQQAAEAAIAAKNADEKTQLQESTVAITRTRAALAAVRSQGKGAASPALLKSVDGAFASLSELKERLDGITDPAMQKQATEVASAASALKTTFVPRGWKPPRSAPELQARAKSADRAGARAVTTGEKAKLARLHLGAARQHLIDGWAGINAGRVEAVDLAAGELGAALAFASEPRLMGELDAMTADLEVTESVMLRLIDTVQRNHPSNLSDLKLLAFRLDRILALQGKQSGWVTRIQPPDTVPPRSTPEPTIAHPQVADASKPQLKDAAPPVNIGETRIFERKIRLEDKRLRDEHVGDIILRFTATLSPSGQVHVSDPRMVRAFYGRATHLQVTPKYYAASSYNDNGRQYCRITLTLGVSTGGQTKGGELGGHMKITGKVEEVGGEIGVQGKVSSSVSLRAAGDIHREFRIDVLPTPLDLTEIADGVPKVTTSRLFMSEETRQDLEDFEVDDSEVGGGVFDTDWEIDSD